MWGLMKVFWLCLWPSEDVQAEMNQQVQIPITVALSPAGSVGCDACGEIHVSAPLLLWVRVCPWLQF